MEIAVGDVVEMKKKHPCGAKTMKVLRTGLDYRFECTGCGKIILAPRRLIEKNIKKKVENE
jgi:hypothetical protein